MSEFDSELRLALAEVVNIALGHAAEPLSMLVGEHVVLSVPEIERFPASSISERLAKLLGDHARVHLVGQAFRPHLRGECWFVLHDPRREVTRRVLGSAVSSEGEDKGLVLELANIVIGACVGKISEVLKTETSFSPPALHLHDEDLDRIGELLAQDLVETILVRTAFEIEGIDSFDGILLILLPHSNLEWLAEALQRFLEG